MLNSAKILDSIPVELLVGWLIGWLWFNVTFSDISAI